MTKILGQIPGSLARILDVSGGRVLADELLDAEGINLVYAVDSIVAGETVGIGILDLNATVAASSSGAGTVAPLRAMSVIGVTVAVDVVANLNQVSLCYDNIGGEGDTDSCVLWAWDSVNATGGSVTIAGGGFVIGGVAQATVPTQLIPDYEIAFPWLAYSVSTVTNPPRGIGRFSLAVNTNAGVGGVQIAAGLVCAFRLELGGTIASLLPPGF